MNVLPLSCIKSMRRVKITGSNTKLKLYDGTTIKSHGKVNLRCKWNRNERQVEFEVVNNDTIPILGAQTSVNMGLVKFNLEQVDSIRSELNVNHIKSEFADIFNGVG